MAQPDLDAVLHGTLLGEGTNNAGVAVLLADEHGQYVAANTFVCELTGYTRGQIVRFRAGELSADDSSRGIYEKLMARKKMQGRKLVRCRDGSIVPCRYWGIPTTVASLPYFLLLLWATGAPLPAES
jgi:PAS domain S-box-containing protein